MNCDQKTIESFGSEWKKHHQGNIAFDELKNQFNKYFRISRGLNCQNLQPVLIWAVALVVGLNF